MATLMNNKRLQLFQNQYTNDVPIRKHYLF